MRIVIYDREADDLNVYNASAISVSDGYIIFRRRQVARFLSCLPF